MEIAIFNIIVEMDSYNLMIFQFIMEILNMVYLMEMEHSNIKMELKYLWNLLKIILMDMLSIYYKKISLFNLKIN